MTDEANALRDGEGPLPAELRRPLADLLDALERWEWVGTDTTMDAHLRATPGLRGAYYALRRVLARAAKGHPFAQVSDAPVRVCWCGKWPDHHIHTGDWNGCVCDECRVLRDVKTELATAIFIDPGAMAELIKATDPPAAILDIIERLNELPDADG